MGQRFDRYQRRYERITQRIDRWDQEGRFSTFHELRRRLYRSNNRKVLGVFAGIAESMGFCVKWTRIIGGFVLLTLAGFFGAHGVMVTLLVGGFFYLLAGMLMQAPRAPGSVPMAADPTGAGTPPPVWRTRPAGATGGAVPYQDVRPRRRVDLAQLDQQLDRLNHRVQRMEAIVTDRQFDWNRRMES